MLRRYLIAPVGRAAARTTQSFATLKCASPRAPLRSAVDEMNSLPPDERQTNLRRTVGASYYRRDLA
jgi:hypothetical protein